MNETRAERWGAASGFAVLLAGAAAVVFERGPVSASDPGSEIAGYFAANQAALRAQGLLFLIGAGFFLWFLGSLRSFLIRAEAGTGRLSTVALAAGVASTMLTVVALAFQVGLAAAANGEAQPALVGIMGALFTVANLPLAVMLIAVAVLSFRTGAFPAWLGWLSILAAAAQLLPTFGIVLDGGPMAVDGWLAAYLPYPLYVVWLASATVAMLRRIGKPPPIPAVPDTPEELIDRMRRHTN
jgi:hypothetical protein